MSTAYFNRIEGSTVGEAVVVGSANSRVVSGFKVTAKSPVSKIVDIGLETTNKYKYIGIPYILSATTYDFTAQIAALSLNQVQLAAIYFDASQTVKILYSPVVTGDNDVYIDADIPGVVIAKILLQYNSNISYRNIYDFRNDLADAKLDIAGLKDASGIIKEIRDKLPDDAEDFVVLQYLEEYVYYMLSQLTTDSISEGNNKYFTSLRVSQNVDVAENTKNNHFHPDQDFIDSIQTADLITLFERSELRDVVDNFQNKVSQNGDVIESIRHPMKVDQEYHSGADIKTDDTPAYNKKYYELDFQKDLSYQLLPHIIVKSKIKGIQECGLSGLVGIAETGLAESTQYFFKVKTDSGSLTEFNITTATDTTWTAVLALMNTAITDASTCNINNGDLRHISDAAGDGSAIELAAGQSPDLFATLTDFLAFDEAELGTNIKDRYFGMRGTDPEAITKGSDFMIDTEGKKEIHWDDRINMTSISKAWTDYLRYA